MNTANRWQIGKVKVTCIVESTGGFAPGEMFAGLTQDEVEAVPWLYPHYVDNDGMLLYAIQAFVLESENKRIIVDTCIGNDKERSYEPWNRLSTPFLEQLDQAGYPATTIDVVLCTHMHVDHVGWNTRWNGKRWIPTFPNARYLFAEAEWNYAFSSGIESQILEDSVLPIRTAGLHELVTPGYRITNEVSLVATPGHTPGHVSVVIYSEGKKATITGDLMHHPIQIADPDISYSADHDPRLAVRTRQRFLDDHCGNGAVVFGTHFRKPAAGLVVREGTGWRFVALP